jgi:hypothetical protein
MGLKTRDWDETVPAGSEDRRQGDNRIRDGKTDMRERVGEEHDFTATSGTGAETGAHKEGSARAYTRTTTETDPDGTTDPEFETATSKGRLLVRHDRDSPATDGLLVGKSDGTLIPVPIGMLNLDASGQFDSNSFVRKVASSVGTSTTTTTRESWVPMSIDGAGLSVVYTPMGSGNLLFMIITGVRFSGGSSPESIGVTFEIDTTRVGSTNALMALTNTGTFPTVWHIHTLGASDITIRAMVKQHGGISDGSIVNFADDGASDADDIIRRLILIEVGNNQA